MMFTKLVGRISAVVSAARTAPQLTATPPSLSPNKPTFKLGRDELPAVLAKRPPTGYLLFASERRPDVANANAHLKPYEVTKVIGKEWSGMGDHAKQRYLDAAAERKAAYQRAMDSLDDDVRERLMAAKSKRRKATRTRRAAIKENNDKRQLASEHGMPSPGPPLPFSLYAAELAADQKGINLGELARHYKQLSDEQKRPYEDRARAARRQYEADLTQWCDMMVQRGQVEALDQLVPRVTWRRLLAQRYDMPELVELLSTHTLVDIKLTQIRDVNWPLKRPFAMFMADNPGKSMVELGKMWSSDDHLQKEYKTKFAQHKMEHSTKLEQWYDEMTRNSLHVVATALMDASKGVVAK